LAAATSATVDAEHGASIEATAAAIAAASAAAATDAGKFSSCTFSHWTFACLGGESLCV
jgi:hypothetical protein